MIEDNRAGSIKALHDHYHLDPTIVGVMGDIVNDQ